VLQTRLHLAALPFRQTPIFNTGVYASTRAEEMALSIGPASKKRLSCACNSTLKALTTSRNTECGYQTILAG